MEKAVFKIETRKADEKYRKKTVKYTVIHFKK